LNSKDASGGLALAFLCLFESFGNDVIVMVSGANHP
jgi:hypothetical protein